MRKIRTIIGTVLCAMVLALGNRMPVMAEEVVSEELKAADTLNLTVSYPSDIKCGEEVTFKLLATGGSGTYKYRIASLTDAQQNFVYDISYGSNSVYGDSDEFKFTFYASGTYYIRFGVMDMGSTPYQTKTTGLLEYPIVINDPNYPSVEELVANVAGECEKSCSTDFDKAVWLHDWILDHADYDYTYSYCAAEGVLARGKGTCESYHRAYVMLLNKVGIPTGRIAGNGHVWTAAQLDGKWYQIDSTWDDMGASYKGTFYEHLYFGLNDDIMKLVHSDHTQPVEGYECNSLEENYFIKTGEIHQWSDPFAEKIRQKIAAGETSFTLPVNSDLPESVANVIYRLVAYELSSENWTNATLSASYDNQKLTCSVTVKTPENNGGDNGNSGGSGSNDGNNGGNTGGGSGSNDSNNGGNTGTDNGNSGNTGTTLTGKQRFASLLYENALGRSAAQSELDYWAQELTNGRTGAEVAYGFLFSEEFQNHNYNNADYVEHLYLSLMGRASDTDGKAGWVKTLENGASRLYVFRQFINSEEFQQLCNTYEIQKGDVSLTEERDQNYNVTCFVARNYTQFLSRNYDTDGLNHWCEAINHHTQSMQEIAYGFVFSTECSNKNLSNTEYVKMLYRGCFDREGDDAGISDWTNALNSGMMDRTQVFWGVANSQEFANMVESYHL